MTGKARTVFLLVDGAALVGVVVFSVLGAIYPDQQGYVVGQIVCAVLILISVVMLRRGKTHRPPP